jgi:hypothetical protein
VLQLPEDWLVPFRDRGARRDPPGLSPASTPCLPLWVRGPDPRPGDGSGKAAVVVLVPLAAGGGGRGGGGRVSVDTGASAARLRFVAAATPACGGGSLVLSRWRRLGLGSNACASHGASARGTGYSSAHPWCAVRVVGRRAAAGRDPQALAAALPPLPPRQDPGCGPAHPAGASPAHPRSTTLYYPYRQYYYCDTVCCHVWAQFGALPWRRRRLYLTLWAHTGSNFVCASQLARKLTYLPADPVRAAHAT